MFLVDGALEGRNGGFDHVFWVEGGVGRWIGEIGAYVL